MTPTANILQLFLQTSAARRQSRWTARQLSAAIDKCERSIVTAIRQLATAGEIKLDDDGSLITPTSLSFQGVSVESEECCVFDALTPADDQLSLFDDCDDVPASPVPTTAPRTTMSLAKSTPVPAAAVCLRPPKPAEPVPAKNQKTKKPADDVFCTSSVQTLDKPCTNSAQDDRMASLRATMAAFSAAFDKRAHASGALPMKQENKLINPMGYVSPMGKTYETPQPPPKKRDEALYDYYLADVKRRFPEWHVKIFNPVTQREGNCKWAVETLAAMMAFGMPESVYWDTVDFCFGKNQHTSAKSPALALLHIVKELKSQYQWKMDWQGV